MKLHTFDRSVERDHNAFTINSGSFLVCPPFNISAKNPNNKWMVDAQEKEPVVIDSKKAFNQWQELYETLSNGSLVYTLPNKLGLQDQVYVANLGIVLAHMDDPTVVISKFKSEPRRDEAQVGIDFFKMLDFDVYQSPDYFEGEADLKYIKDNVYLGGYGIRTASATYEWMKETFNMNIIPLRMRDEYLYHLDCQVFPMNINTVMACTELIDEETIKEIEKHVEIVDVDIDLAYQGICNSVRTYGAILQASNLEDLKLTDEYYDEEKRKVETTTKICQKYGFEPLFINISEMYKSGAMLSCTVMNLNFRDFEYSNV